MLSRQFKTIDVENFEEKLTTSNEAFCLTCLDNGFERWRTECTVKVSKRIDVPELLLGDSKTLDLTEEESENLPHFRYTTQKTGSLKSGWSKAGKELYISLFQLCAEQRNLQDKECKYTLAISHCKDLKRTNSTTRKRQRLSLEARHLQETEERETAEAMRKHQELAMPKL